MSDKKPGGTPKTVSDLARRLGVTRQLISVHRKKPGAPAIQDIEAWGVFLAAVGREGSCPPKLREQIARRRLGLLGILEERERVKLLREQDLTIPKADVQMA